MSVADWFAETVTSGPLLLAAPIAATAGLVSFLSPCVLPLVPGYLTWVTGLSGAELEGRAEGDTLVRTRARVLLGSALFVLGFSAVFVTQGLFFGSLGAELLEHREVVDRVLGVVVLVMGAAFLGLIPGLQREWRMRPLPVTGVAGAPLLGVVFGVGWTPCLGPTLAAVQVLAYTQESAGRGALLTAFYCLGLGIPFLLTGLAFGKALSVFDAVKRHYAVVTRVGGVLLVALGLLLLSGYWDDLVVRLQTWVATTETVL